MIHFVTHVRESNGAQVVSVRASGSSLSPGQIGKIIDSTSGYVTCVLADSTDTGADEEKYVYILENISAGTNGEGVITGTITGVDTSTYAAPYVWLNASGTLSNTPSGGLVQLGKVNEAAGDGTIWFDGNPKKLDAVKPEFFGAVGTSDDTTTFAAMSSWIASRVGSQNAPIWGVGNGKRAIIQLSTRQYRLNSWQPGDYIFVEGNGAVLLGVGDTGTVLDLTPSWQFSGRNFSIHDCTIAVDLQTNNQEQRISLENVDVMGAGTALNTGNSSQSTLFTWKNSSFWVDRMMLAATGDMVLFKDCWVSTRGTTSGYVWEMTGIGCRLFLDNIVGVPNTTFGGFDAWVYVTGQGAGVDLNRFRAGGEAGGIPLVDFDAEENSYTVGSQTFLNVTNSELTQAGAPVVILRRAPSFLRLAGNNGLITSRGIELRNTITAAERAAIAGGNVNWVIDLGPRGQNQRPLSLISYGISDSLVAQVAIAAQGLDSESAKIPVARLVDGWLWSEAGKGRAQQVLNATTATSTNMWGDSCELITATADSGFWRELWNTALSGYSDGVYTAVVDVEVTAGPVNLAIRASNTLSQFELQEGAYVLSVPFVFETGALEAVGYETINQRMINGTAFKFTRFRIFEGSIRCDAYHNNLIGSAAPANGYSLLGDRVITNQFDQLVCVTAGAPGTFRQVRETLRGSGSPEGAVTATVGTAYLRSDGGASTTLYIKESGTGNTGWVAK